LPSLLAIALATASGALYAFALAPGAPAILAWVALAPLLAAWAGVAPLPAAACGAAWAATATALLSRWFPAMLEHYFELAPGAAWAAWLGLAALVNAPAYALLGAWVSWCSRRGAIGPLAVAGGWLLAETLRASGPIGNPYALLATSQVDTAWAQAADAIGAFGVGALVALGNAALAAVLVPRLRGPRPAPALALAAGVLAAAWGYGAWRLGTEFGDGAPLRVAVVQPATPAGHEPARAAERLARLVALTGEARAHEPDLVFWPEYAVDFYLRERGPERDRLLALTDGWSGELLVGGPHYRLAEPAPDYFTSVFLLRDGGLAGRYDKVRLVPFAESTPFGVAPARSARYRAGESLRPLETRHAAVGAFLCGEVLFAEVARGLARAGAGLLANPSNDGWFGAPEPALHQLRVAALRAIENRRPLVRAATDGYSAVLDAHGRALALGAPGVPAVLEASVRPSHDATLQQRWASAPGWLALALVAAASRPRSFPPPTCTGDPP
jgi:apolipoprotein N-acyltransferase